MKLKNLPVEIKIAFLFLYIFTALGFIFAFLITRFSVGNGSPLDIAGNIADYYRGNPEKMLFGKSPLELSEISHFHSFISSVVIFIISYLFSYTRLKRLLKNLVIIATFSALFGFILSPWAIKYLSPHFAYIKILSTALLVLGVMFMGFKVLKDMWL